MAVLYEQHSGRNVVDPSRVCTNENFEHDIKSTFIVYSSFKSYCYENTCNAKDLNSNNSGEQ